MALIGVVTLIVVTTVLMPHMGYGSSGTGSNAPTSQTQNVNVVNTPAGNAQQSGTCYDVMDARPGYTPSPTEGRFSFVTWLNGDPTLPNSGKYAAYLYYPGKMVADSSP